MERELLYPRKGGEWTAYNPPKRTGCGHQARKRDPSLAWNETQNFLWDHCLYALSPAVAKLTCWDPSAHTSRSASQAGLEKAVERFGPASERRCGFQEWVLKPSQFEEALHCCIGDVRWAGEEIGPLTINFSYRIAWRSLTGSDDTAIQSLDLRNDASLLGVGIWTRQVHLQPNFVFPLAWDSREFHSFLAEIEPSCPFRFRDQYFYRLLPSASGEFSQIRKLKKGWRGNILQGLS